LITFFTDRDLGHLFPELLSKAGIAVERHDDHFGPATADEAWLREVGRKGWFVLTHDQRIRYKPNERDAVMEAGVGLLVLVGAVPHRQLAEGFIASVEVVERFAARHPRPFIAKMRRPVPSAARRRRAGTVEMWLSEAEWKKRRRK
jgi:hypothetical protein